MSDSTDPWSYNPDPYIVTTDTTVTLAPGNITTPAITGSLYANVIWNSNLTGTATYTPGTTYTISASSAPFFSNDINADALDVKGKAVVNGSLEVKDDIKLGEHSLTDRLNKIEERLAIMNRNSGLEERWETLRKLGNEYRELEADLLEKEKIWDILKK